MSEGDILVNGVRIERHRIRLEAQYHSAAYFAAAEHDAARALVDRELLLQEATRQGLVRAATGTDDSEEGEHEAIQALTRQQVPVPDVNEATCRAFYDRDQGRFTSPDLFEASHILFAVNAGDDESRADALASAERTLGDLRRKPERFVRLARERSGCPSAEQGGSLGQITRGETLPEFEAALDELSAGELLDRVLETEHGYHVVRLDQRVDGERAPYEAVRARIQIYLRDAAWRRDLRHYIDRLARAAVIEGFDLASKPPPAPPKLESVPAPRSGGGCGGGGCGGGAAEEAPQRSPVKLRVIS